MYNSKKKTKSTMVKPLNSNIPTYERTLDIVMPPKIDRNN